MTDQEIIEGLNELRGKDIIAWMYHTPSFKSPDILSRCYVKPQYVLDNNEWNKINSALFPDSGSLVVVLVQYKLSALIENDIKYEYQFGCPVKIRINKLFTPEDQDSYINNKYDRDHDNTKFVLMYNKDFTESKSEIWISPLPEAFYHVLEIQSSFDTLNSSREKALSIEDSRIYPFSTQVFLKIQNALYGPCSHDKRGDIIHLYGTPKNQYMINEYPISECKLYPIRDNENNIKFEFFLHNAQSLKATEQYDWIPEDRLLGGFLDAVKNDNQSINIAIKELKNKILTSIIRNTDIAFTPDRIKRIKSSFDLYLNDDAQINDIIKCSLSNKEIFSFFVNKIIEDYPDEFWKSYKAAYPDGGEAERRLEELRKKVTEEENKLKNLNVGEKQENNSAQITQLTSELGNLQKEYELLQSELNEYKNQEGLLENLIQKRKTQEDLEKYLRDRIDNLKSEKEQIQKQKNRLLQEFGDALDATAKAVDLKLLDTVLRSVEEKREEDTMPEYHFTSPEDLSMPSRDEILENITSFVQNKAHRNISRNDIANYLICITQGFITTFVGEPGTGKTSLCNILAKSLGLIQKDFVRFVDISVERGWTSHKEFIGYYNPLTKRLEPSNAEVFSAFEQLNEEAKRPYDSKQFSPFLILLDEANLSPLEHYWAAFLRNCDFDSTNNRTISLGGNKILHLPEHLRFLATVNFDHTTEELSPRFLDRSWIITLEPTSLDENNIEETDVQPLKISFNALQTAFGSVADNMDIKIDDQMEDKWEKIQAIFSNEKCNLPIMPRNLKMVKNYISMACQCMDLSSNKTKFAPLDYALSQKILPTINGSGDNYAFLIDELLEECKIETMPISAKHLKRMKRVADKNLGYYQFFAR